MLYNAFVDGTYQSQALTADQELTVNWYIEQMQVAGATTRAALYPTPGVSPVVMTNIAGVGRAHIFINGREFAVEGTQFIEIAFNGVVTIQGTVALDSNPATISSNGAAGNQLFITSGGNGYLFALGSNTFSQIGALNGKATMGDFLDGRFLALSAPNSTLYASNLNDGSTWQTGLVFAARSLAPDSWVSMKVVGRYIWLLGTQTSEIWYDTGAFPMPFAPYSTGLLPHGIAAPYSASFIGGVGLCWLQTSKGGGQKVMLSSGFSPEEVSTIPLQLAIGGYGTISDAIGDNYTDQGHTFYILTFPTAGVTWCLDVANGTWTQRGSWSGGPNFLPWRPMWHASAFGQHRMLDIDGSGIYQMSNSFTTDIGGTLIRRVRRAPALMNEMRRIYYSAFELDVQPGLGLPGNVQGSSPQVMMRFSNDGGQTWSSERMRTAGAIGAFGQRIRWVRCGQARRRVFEVSVTDPIPWRITGAYLTLGNQAQSSAAVPVAIPAS